MISPLEVYRARREWGVGWFIAWTRLRAAERYDWNARDSRAIR